MQTATTREFGIRDAAIYGAQVAVLQDPDALRLIRQAITEARLAPESAIAQLLARFERAFENLDGSELKNWGADLRDPWHAVLRELDLQAERGFGLPAGAGLVLVADELTPSLVTRRYSHPVRGIVCVRGGRYSHGAVLARTFGVPTVIGIDHAVDRIRHGESVIVWGDDGRVWSGVEDGERETARRSADERARVRRALAAGAAEPGRTADGTPVQVMANLESPRDLEDFEPGAAEGVGLFRTEFLFMARSSFPSEREQSEIYQSVLQRFPGRPVVFRTLDVGGDKPLRYFKAPAEANPAMGWRGLRVSLRWPDLLLVQLKAVVQACRAGDAQVMLPMISTLDELRAVRALLERVEGAARLPLGVMIEVPAAALALEDLAGACDFFSVGTNDLVQYLYAVDRDNAWVADLYQPYHPAHLRLLAQIARTSRALGKPASVCGEMAGQAAGALFLVGAGFRRLSVAGPFVAETKAMLRQAELPWMQGVAAQAQACRTASEAQALLEDSAARLWRTVVQRSG